MKAGLHKGEAFYNRADISELHTKDKWVQHGFEVKASKVPFKVVARRGSKKATTALPDAGDVAEVNCTTQHHRLNNETFLSKPSKIISN